MLKRIKTSDLKIGSRYSAPLFFDDGKSMLLPLASPITEYELGVLEDWSIPFVLTEGNEIKEGENLSGEDSEELEEIEELDEFEDLEELTNDLNDETEEEEIAVTGTKITKTELANVAPEKLLKLNQDKLVTKLYKIYNEIIPNIKELFNKINQKEKVDTNEISAYINAVKSLIQKVPSLCMSFILDTDIEENDLARSSINTTILSIILSQKLGLPEAKIDEIAISALLHDIGMLKVPENIVNKTGSLTDVEKQAISTHTSYGYKTALKDLLYTKEIALNIMQHHERWDGTGVPNGLAGEEITIGARIISVADAFVAMITPKPYRDLMLGYQAMKNLLADNARRFDPTIIRIMIKNIGIYPIGSIVLMNNASLARVVKSSPNAPMRPFIKILIDETGEVLGEKGEVLDLKENKNLFIVRAIDPRAYRNK